MHQGSELFQPRMNEKADVGDRQLRDLGYFLVGEIVLKFQPDDLLLVRRKLLQQPQRRRGAVRLLQLRRGRGLVGRALFVQDRHGDDPGMFALMVQGAVSADRKKPRLEVLLAGERLTSASAGRFLVSHEADESL